MEAGDVTEKRRLRVHLRRRKVCCSGHLCPFPAFHVQLTDQASGSIQSIGDDKRERALKDRRDLMLVVRRTQERGPKSFRFTVVLHGRFTIFFIKTKKFSS